MNYVHNFEENLFRQGSHIWMCIWRVDKEIDHNKLLNCDLENFKSLINM